MLRCEAECPGVRPSFDLRTSLGSADYPDLHFCHALCWKLRCAQRRSGGSPCFTPDVRTMSRAKSTTLAHSKVVPLQSSTSTPASRIRLRPRSRFPPLSLKKDRSVPGGPIRSFWKASQGHACRGQEDIWPGSRIGGARRDQRDAAQDGGDGRFRNSVAMPATSTQPPKLQVRAVASVTETPLGDR
jgi:hypothetical protein